MGEEGHQGEVEGEGQPLEEVGEAGRPQGEGGPPV